MSDTDESIEELLRGISPRPEPPDDVRARVFEAVGQEWQARKSKRFRPLLALAASIAVAVIIGLTHVEFDDSFGVQLAESASLWVADEHLEAGGQQLKLVPGTAMVAEAASRLVTQTGADLRLRAGTEIHWLAPDVITLNTGSVYFATEGTASFQIRTPMGVVKDIGTRFMVTLKEGELEVAMRDGITEVATERGIYMAKADRLSGDVVRVAANRITVGPEPASDNRWAWIHDVHPGYSETGVAALLKAISGDLGLSMEFSSPAVMASVMSAQLDGDLSGLPPEDALQVVLRTSGLQVVEEGPQRLLIGFQSGIR
jgi:hypothetical protein